MVMTRITLSAVLAALTLVAAPAQAGWITSWAAAPVRPIVAMGEMMRAPAFKNQTLVQRLRIAAGGKAVRIRFSNAYGTAPLDIGGARIALLDKDGNEVPGSERTLTFSGKAHTSIATGAPLLSDTVNLTLPDLSRLAVSIYLPGETGACTCHQSALDEMLVSPEGDFLGKSFTPARKLMSRAFVSAVEVDGANNSGTIAVLGDSISDGIGSTASANHRWPDYLADRLSASARGKWGIANLGISGNRILSDGMGDSALARLDRDILALPGIKYMIVFEGVNDLGIGFGPSRNGPIPMNALPSPKLDLEQMLAGYRQIVERAHARGIKVIGATIAPYKGATYWSQEGEAVRQGINAEIRSGKLFDGMVDFDKAFADPANPQEMRPGYHMGDHLHGTDAGYEAIAKSIDLNLFR
jgi:lysophospholipase L1-like esterase